MSRSPDVVIVGGGVIGCAVAYYAAKRGLKVTLVDQPKRGRATTASAGGLWPVGESVGLGCGVIFHQAARTGDLKIDTAGGPTLLPQCFLDFALKSNAMFPKLAGELRQESGVEIEWERTSLLYVLYNEVDEAFARAISDRCPAARERIQWVSAEELARAEPGVTRETRGAVAFVGDDQVNPYELARAFRQGAERWGATMVNHAEVQAITLRNGRVHGIKTAAGRIECDAVVNAAGSWAGQVSRMVGIDLPIVPIRGQILGTETMPKTLNACLSTVDCYIVQKKHGEIIIGSTTEDTGFDTGVTSSALQSLSAGAIRAIPSLESVFLKRTWSGLRPGDAG